MQTLEVKVTGVEKRDQSGIWGNEWGWVSGPGKLQGVDLAPRCWNSGKAQQNRGNVCRCQRPAVVGVSGSPPPSVPWEIGNHVGLAAKDKDTESSHAESQQTESYLGVLCLLGCETYVSNTVITAI